MAATRDQREVTRHLQALEAEECGAAGLVSPRSTEAQQWAERLPGEASM